MCVLLFSEWLSCNYNLYSQGDLTTAVYRDIKEKKSEFTLWGIPQSCTFAVSSEQASFSKCMSL